MQYIDFDENLKPVIRSFRASYKTWFKRFNEKFGHIFRIPDNPNSEQIRRAIQFLDSIESTDRIMFQALQEALEQEVMQTSKTSRSKHEGNKNKKAYNKKLQRY